MMASACSAAAGLRRRNMKATILTLFPEMFPGTLAHSIAGKALEKGLWSFECMNIRDFATHKYKTVDDKSYGGGTGLVMKPDVVGAAIDAALEKNPGAQLIYMTPRGAPLTQELVEKLAQGVHKIPPPACGGIQGGGSLNNQSLPLSPPVNGGVIEKPPAGEGTGLILLCGRYEGVDQRVLDYYKPLEISLGDYVLSGGEIAAQILLDAVIRLLPGVLPKDDATAEESFSIMIEEGKLLEHPQYTQPAEWKGLSVPDVLLSGHHEKISKWRLEQALEVTKMRRPDLLNNS